MPACLAQHLTSPSGGVQDWLKTWPDTNFTALFVHGRFSLNLTLTLILPLTLTLTFNLTPTQTLTLT